MQRKQELPAASLLLVPHVDDLAGLQPIRRAKPLPFTAVSYTHLDVYKRQQLHRKTSSIPMETTVMRRSAAGGETDSFMMPSSALPLNIQPCSDRRMSCS